MSDNIFEKGGQCFKCERFFSPDEIQKLKKDSYGLVYCPEHKEIFLTTKEDLDKKKQNDAINSTKLTTQPLRYVLLRDAHKESIGRLQAEIAKEVKKDYNFATMSDTREIFYYKDGTYHEGAERVIAAKIQAWLSEMDITERQVKGIVGEVLGHVERSTYTPRVEFNQNKNLICMENGVYNLTTGKFCEHSPEYKHLSKLPIIYAENAKCPAFDKFVAEVVAAQDVPLVYEFLGYCVYPSAEFDKALMCFGDGHNGKSTFIDTVERFLGSHNCSHVPVQKFDGERNRFALAELYGKMANLSGDLSPLAMKETGNFKQACGGDTLFAERKGKDPFSFKNTAKLIYGANRIPVSEDRTRAFGRRWLLLNFPNVFEENDDNNLLEKITTPEELSGIFLRAIEGLNRLLENHKFTRQKSSEDTLELWTRLSDTVACFVADEIEGAYDGWLSKRELWDSFNRYCVGKNGAGVSEKMFFYRFKNCIRTEETRKKELRGLMGVRFKNQKNEVGQDGNLQTFAKQDV